LPDFLLSVWAFIVLNRSDNSIGKDTIAAWSDPKTKGRYTGNDGASIEQDIAVIVPPPMIVEASEPEEMASPDSNADPKRITVNNYGVVQNQKFISIETMNGDINL
jgi:hypothetical protein